MNIYIENFNSKQTNKAGKINMLNHDCSNCKLLECPKAVVRIKQLEDKIKQLESYLKKTN